MELSESDVEPITGDPVEDEAPAPRASVPRRIAPAGALAPAPAGSDSGEEALRMVWAMADLLIERGYFTRAEVMKALRGK
jgi:hypothetical protein